MHDKYEYENVLYFNWAGNLKLGFGFIKIVKKIKMCINNLFFRSTLLILAICI